MWHVIIQLFSILVLLWQIWLYGSRSTLAGMRGIRKHMPRVFFTVRLVFLFLFLLNFSSLIIDVIKIKTGAEVSVLTVVVDALWSIWNAYLLQKYPGDDDDDDWGTKIKKGIAKLKMTWEPKRHLSPA